MYIYTKEHMFDLSSKNNSTHIDVQWIYFKHDISIVLKSVLQKGLQDYHSNSVIGTFNIYLKF